MKNDINVYDGCLWGAKIYSLPGLIASSKSQPNHETDRSSNRTNLDIISILPKNSLVLKPMVGIFDCLTPESSNVQHCMITLILPPRKKESRKSTRRSC